MNPNLFMDMQAHKANNFSFGKELYSKYFIHIGTRRQSAHHTLANHRWLIESREGILVIYVFITMLCQVNLKLDYLFVSLSRTVVYCVVCHCLDLRW
jgi:hypothetical protein